MLRFKKEDGSSYKPVNKVLLKDVSKKITVGIANSATHAYREKGVILFRNQNIKPNKLDDKDIIYIDEEFEKSYKNKRLKENDLLIARTGYPGTACIVPKKYENSQSFTTLILRPDFNKVDSLFLCQYLNSETAKRYINSTQIGGNQKNCGASIIENMPIPYLELVEQKKIADFLTEIDNVIECSEKEIESLEQQKKGILQKIFNQEVRFKKEDGSDYPQWKEKNITEIADTYIGLVTTMTAHYVNTGVPLIRNSDIKENKFIFKEPIYLDYEFAEKNKAKSHKIDDVITVHTGDVGTSAIIDEKLEGSIGFATIVSRIINKKEITPHFLCFFLNSSQNKKNILNLITGDGRNNLNLKEFNNLDIPIPCVEEQNKISDFLSSFDEAIDAAKEELETWKNIKKGLLQQMFE